MNVVAPRLGRDDVTAEDAQPRVMVVDDHTFYRDGLVGLLRDNGVNVVADVPNGETALRVADERSPDVVVMDFNMPGLGGVESTRRLCRQQPGTGVLMLTVSQDEADILEATLAGASGFVLKDGPIEDVVVGIDRVAAGHTFFSPRAEASLLRHVQGTADRAPLDRLGPLEVEVLRNLAEGRTLTRTAARLRLSEAKVRQCVRGVIVKLQAESRGEIAVRAIRDRIV
jgi:DNA-binding NarL/FixJ family response regulator